MTDKLLRQALQFDPLGVAERITGERVGELNSPATGLGFLLAQEHGALKENLLTQRGDTTLVNDLDRYVGIIEANGFTKVLSLPFRGYDRDETLFVYAHSDGLLLRFDTYDGTRVNGANVYYNWRPSRTEYHWQIISSGSFSFSDPTVWTGYHDAREALLFKLSELRAHGSFVSPWVQRPFLWFLHYMDTKTEGYDYEAINAERLAMMPAWVQEFVGAPA